MKKTIFILFLLTNTISAFAQIKTEEKKRDIEFYETIKKWFSAWKLIGEDTYEIDTLSHVDFIFFDDKYVYSTSNITITNGILVKGYNLNNLKLKWKKALHHDTIRLPDKSLVPIGLMSFAAEIPNEKKKSFFIMPLPSFWMKLGIESKELGIENLLTGIFIHEFSHSQQMQNFGRQIALYEKEKNFGKDFNDNLVQNIFQKDTSYVKHYNQEVDLLYSLTRSNLHDIASLEKAIILMKQRQNVYFKDEYNGLTNIDNIFLTMEGLGQYSMYLWLIHPKGGNIKKEIAIEGVRRNRNWWSQDEGFALFLILDELSKSKKWAKEMFGINTVSVTTLIEQIIN